MTAGEKCLYIPAPKNAVTRDPQSPSKMSGIRLEERHLDYFYWAWSSDVHHALSQSLAIPAVFRALAVPVSQDIHIPR